jgi:hypothetical protein
MIGEEAGGLVGRNEVWLSRCVRLHLLRDGFIQENPDEKNRYVNRFYLIISQSNLFEQTQIRKKMKFILVFFEMLKERISDVKS